jgi:hypothetical protein
MAAAVLRVLQAKYDPRGAPEFAWPIIGALRCSGVSAALT